MRYEWRVVYNQTSDGLFECLDQYNEDGSENKYTDIDRTRLERFILLDSDSGEAKVVLHLEKGQKLIYRVRHLKHIPVSNLFYKDNPDRSTEEAIWIVGFHENRGGVNVQMLSFLFEDGHIELMDRWRSDHALFAAAVLIPEEERDYDE